MKFKLSIPTLLMVMVPLGIFSMIAMLFGGEAAETGAVLAFSPAAFTTNPYRTVYDVIKKFPGFTGKVITLGYMRFMVALNATNQITFNVFNDAATILAGEYRLRTSDSFFSIAHQFLIGKIASGGNILTMKPQPWANPQVFSGSTEILGLQELYWSGLLNITVNNRVYYDSYPVGNFQETETKEEGQLLASGGEAYGRDNWRGDKTSVRDLVPTVFYNGNANITCQISTFPTAASAHTSWAGESSSTNYAIYTNYGFYIKGSALSDGQSAEFGRYLEGKA